MSRFVKPFPGVIPPVPGRGFLWLASGFIVWALGGCMSIPQDQSDPDDALESLNRPIYDFNEGLDRLALKPVTHAYTSHVPQEVRSGVSHFYDNIQYLNTVLNGFLQGKVGQGFSDLARFGINSTVGVLGVFDVATPLGFEQHREDFGQTLAVWQASDGAYVVYPVLGPSNVRDTGGIVVNLLTNPILYAVPPIAIPLGILEVVDLRARNEGFVRFRDVAADKLDPYAFTRASYLQHRQSEIYDGNPPRPKYELFDDPADDSQIVETPLKSSPNRLE